jgi:uncharacterized protein (TIGR02246 family)
MRKNHSTTLRAASVAALAIVSIVGSTACSDANDTTAPRAVLPTPARQVSESGIPTDAILEIVAGRTAAWAAKDPVAYASAFAPDLRFINPVGVLFSGREAFRGLHGFLFNGPFAASTLGLAVREIQFLTGTVAIVYLDLSITGYAFLPPGVTAPSDGVLRARVTWVVERRGGEWQILFMQNTDQ